MNTDYGKQLIFSAICIQLKKYNNHNIKYFFGHKGG